MIHHPGQLAGYWPQTADDLAWAEGYPTVSACEQAIARGDPGTCRSGLKGFADYGIAEWRDDRIVSINGKTVLGPDDFLLEDALFLGAKHLYKTDGVDDVDGVCGLEVEPADAVLIRYRDIIAMCEEDRSRRLVLTLADGEQTAIPVSPVFHGALDWRSRASRRHEHAQRIIETIEAHR
ncbi:hypothetical protein [Bifidobacterium thermophilum]|uniref:Uncharacterized protein n=1 Tax=Bifidobacterium thermophilum TaxID=33905 RepID=A0A7X9NQN8_9BIFI|nr:hypothetical protein [Bifidobacterium thermophilum]NME61828.1 hypothetical protein [Bifidobacterium thermophilum]